MQWSAAALVAGMTVLLLVTHFVAWHTYDLENDQNHGHTSAWGYHDRFGDIGHDAGTWFDDGFEDREGIEMLRAGAILLTLAVAGGFAATAFILTDLRWRAGLVAAGAAAAAIVATALIAMGTQEFSNIHVDKAIGYFLAVIAGILGLVGALLAFLPTPGLELKKNLESWSKGAS